MGNCGDSLSHRLWQLLGNVAECHFFAAKALKGNEYCNEKKQSLRLFKCLHTGNGYDICNASMQNSPL